MSFVASPNPVLNPYILVTTKMDLALPAKTSVDTPEKIELLGTTDIASAWRTIGASESVKITGDKDKTVKTTTGMTLTLSEKMPLEVVDLNIDEYNELRTAINQKNCKVILVDPDKTDSVPYAESIILSVLPDIGEEMKVKISGESTSSSLDNIFSIVALT